MQMRSVLFFLLGVALIAAMAVPATAQPSPGGVSGSPRAADMTVESRPSRSGLLLHALSEPSSARGDALLPAGASALIGVLAIGAAAIVVRRGRRQVHHLAEQLDAMRTARDAAEEASRAKSEFLASMSHEIRTPLNGVVGMAGLALAAERPSDQRRFLETLQSSADSLGELLNGILDFSKIESRKLEIEAVPFALRRAMAEAIAPQQVRADQKGLSLSVDIDRDVPESVIGDPLRLRQVVTNLVSNAVKFSDRGHVRVRVRQERRRRKRASIHIEVRDTGPGIPRDKHATVFEPFTQAEGSTTRRYGGSGLGLAISRNLVQLMGGRMWLESEPGAGSAFHFTVSVDVAAQQTEEPMPSVSDAPRPPAVLRILLAEDNLVNQQVAAGLLARRGHHVTTVNDGAEAIAAVARDTFDVVLMDVQMPGVDGLEATGAIRRREAANGGRIRIVALTAHATTADRDRCLAAGMDGYLSKPIDRGRLFAVLEGQPAAPPAPPRPAVESASAQEAGGRAPHGGDLDVFASERDLDMGRVRRQGHAPVVSDGLDSFAPGTQPSGTAACAAPHRRDGLSRRPVA